LFASKTTIYIRHEVDNGQVHFKGEEMRKTAAGLGLVGSLVCGHAIAQSAPAPQSAPVSLPTSSVTLYGLVDTGVYYGWGGNAGTKSVVGQDHYHTSRWGLLGAEDLGGGLTTIFKVESRFLPRTGAQQDSATFFNDEAYVGLRSTTFGTLKLGRVYSPFYLAVAGRIDPFNGDGIGSMTGFTSIGHNLSPGNPYDTQKKIPNLDVRTSNAVDYASPTLYGVTFQYQTSLPGAGIAHQQAVVLKYDSTHFLAETGYERQAYQNHAFDWHVGGGVVFGPVKVTIGYTQGYFNDDEYARGNKTRTEFLGLTYHVTPASTILAAVANMHSDETTLIDAANHTGSSAVKFAVGYEYSLSKRTLVYLHYAHVSKPLSYIFVSNTNKVMMGIDHKF
jgi:predicted porin